MSGPFVAGGTLKPGIPSYIERAADAELDAAVRAGDYCSVLTTRQMGKSSLMARTAARLRDGGIACATVDLQGKGDQAPPPMQWYYGVAKQVADGLGLPSTWSVWWKEQSLLLPAQLLVDFFADVALRQIPGRIVVFIDEVDWTIRLPFSDEFFASIRSCLNRRATEPAFERLTFVLLGSAAPAQLIKDATRTPFNVGRSIELTDFTAAEAAPLAHWLGEDGEPLLRRILYWTDGHPYLTQMLCARVDERRGQAAGTPDQLVDAIVADTLLTSAARKAENNLKFVADRLTQATTDLRRVLRTYRDVLRGKPVPDVPTSPVHTSLRLSGVVKTDADGLLHVRNRVYGRVFDEAWLRRTMPSRARPMAIAATVAAIAATSVLWYFVIGPRLFVAGPIQDEALNAGVSASTFVAADADYFHDMDGGQAYSPDEIRGRNMWLVWTGGNDRFWDAMAIAAPLDLLKTISSHPALPYGRRNRFRFFGLINEPCFKEAAGPDSNRWGLWLDRRDSNACPVDPFADGAKYPGVKIGARGKTVPQGSYYGEPTGIVGLRLFPNPQFGTEQAKLWDAERFYRDPLYYSERSLVRPYRVGVSCAFCHAGPSPISPPADPENPRWQDLAATVGAQYFSADRIFNWNTATSSYFFQLLHTARPGTFDMSLFASDGINNPQAMGPIYNLMSRLSLAKRWGVESLSVPHFKTLVGETRTPASVMEGAFEPPDKVVTPRFQADGADSAGLLSAVKRFYLSLGTFSEELQLHASPLERRGVMTPVDIRVLRQRSVYFQATEDMAGFIGSFLLRASVPPRLRDAPGGASYLTADARTLTQGMNVFADRCASCHSSKQPMSVPALEPQGCAGPGYLTCWNKYWEWAQTNAFKQEMRQIVVRPDFLTDNYLSTDLRIPITLLETNACRSLGSNAIGGRIWDGFSSDSYKALPSVGGITINDPFTGSARQWVMPAGGRGYTRPPSLIGLWSTAPYLLNNTVGPFESEPSVAARMRSFKASIEQLLWPERRSRDRLGVGVIDRFTDDVAGVVGNGLNLGIVPRGVPIGLLANIQLRSEDADPAQQVAYQRKIAALFRTLSTEEPTSSPRNEAPRDPRSAQAAFMERAPTLLEVSACPDFVVNRGHYFGRDLRDADKLALIEFLKTF